MGLQGLGLLISIFLAKARKCHPFQNRYTHKIIIFELFRSLQLQFFGPDRN